MSIYKADPIRLRTQARNLERRAARCDHYPTVAAWRREAERLRHRADALRSTQETRA